MGLIFILITVGIQADIFDYFRDRGTDLLDVFLFRVSAARKAKGIGARVRVTALAQLGAVYFEGEHFGLDRRGFGVWKERRTQGGLSLLSFASVENDVIWGNYYLEENSAWMNFEERGLIRNDVYWDDGRRHPLSINAEIQPGLLPGLELGIYPVEILDFIMGFFTLDPQNDDLSRVLKYAPEYTTVQELYPETEELPEDIQEIILKTEPLPLQTEDDITTNTMVETESKQPPSLSVISENKGIPETKTSEP
jgi:hypothetical protein